ncbi:hypothetical protein HK102_002358 [Quaeritorhiza haematococci]|nr:hypothetical protein HK102_002358 [Quaeritorhiza haematococci]
MIQDSLTQNMIENAKLDWSKVVDVHCHIQETPLDQLREKLPAVKVSKFFVMGTQLSDWPLVETLAKEFPDRIVPAFGVHPWFAHQHIHLSDGETNPSETEDWLSTLLSDHSKYPNSILGEIGLDGVAKDMITNKPFDFETQQKVFRVQVGLLGSELNSPSITTTKHVSIHAVRCFGVLVDTMKEWDALLAKGCGESGDGKVGKKGKKEKRKEKSERVDGQSSTSRNEPSSGPADSEVSSSSTPKDSTPSSTPVFNVGNIMLHSYSGSPDTLKMLLRLRHVGPRIYCSVSYFVNGRNLAKGIERIKAIPDDRILIESDLGDIDRVEGAIVEVVRMVSEAKGWSVDETLERTYANAMRFLGG